MAKYKVLLERPIYESVWVDVEADSEANAYAEALDIQNTWELNWELSPEGCGEVSAVDCIMMKE